jgi:DNA-directed RNA polymerase subunit RPC12/RpoP
MHSIEKKTEQVYLCPVCSRKYSSLDALYLTTNQWKCEDCGVEVQRELGDTGAAGDDESFRAHQVSRRRPCRLHRRSRVWRVSSGRWTSRFDGLKRVIHNCCSRTPFFTPVDGGGLPGYPQATMAALLKKVKSQLQPITMQLKRLRDQQAPNYGSLHEWVVARHVAQANAAAGAAGGGGGGGGNGGGVSIDILGEMQFEVNFDSGAGAGANGADGADAAPEVAPRVLPPWMRREGMVDPSAASSSSSTAAAVAASTPAGSEAGPSGAGVCPTNMPLAPVNTSVGTA